MKQKQFVEQWLVEKRFTIAPIIQDLSERDLLRLDFSKHNSALDSIDLEDTAAFSRWLFQEVLQGKIGIGGYLEDRVIYRRSAHFAGEALRTIHLGVDLWLPAGTPVYVPLPGVIHSFQDNQGFGNYGPTIIVEHTLENHVFYTLYGHLSRSSLRALAAGQKVTPDQPLATIGNFPENGDWPPHLHFQAMTDLLGWTGDFPGVVATSQLPTYASVCLDPKLLLRYEND